MMSVERFSERFLLSLGSCENCLVVDDELNVLPISGGKPLSNYLPRTMKIYHLNARELKELKGKLG